MTEIHPEKRAMKYAQVYNKILQMIRSGMYPEGSKLISEPALAREMNVSRSTLRQALHLLQEDGIIESRQGIGNFVHDQSRIMPMGLEQMSNPVRLAMETENLKVRLELIPEISSEFAAYIFQREMPMILSVHRYYCREGKLMAYGYSQLASDCQYLTGLNLNDSEAVCHFLEEKIYLTARSRSLKISVTELSDNLIEAGLTSERGQFYLLWEQIRNQKGEIIIVNKFYIPVEHAALVLYSSNE